MLTTRIKHLLRGRWLQSTEVAYLLLTQQPQIRLPVFQKMFRGNIIDVAEVNQRRWLEESGQWLENVDRTHLVLASGKLVLKKVVLVSFFHQTQ